MPTNRRLTKKQQEIIDLMRARPELHIRPNEYEHMQELTDGRNWDDLKNPPFWKYFYKSTLNRLIDEGYLEKALRDDKYKIYKLKEEQPTI